MTAARTNPVLKLLDDQKIEQIHEASYRILRELGIKVEDADLRQELCDLGCDVAGDRVKINSDLLDKVIANAKKHNRFTLTSRTGKKVEMNPETVVSHSSNAIPDIIDLETGQCRRTNQDDVIATTRLMNQLDEMDMPCALVYPNDVPPEINQLKQAELLIRYSTKPIYACASEPDTARYLVELFDVFAGTDDKDMIGLVGISPESPLKFPKTITDAMKIIISAGIPVAMLSAPLGGLSGPLSIAGGLAQVNAELLAFAAISYLYNPETPLLYGPRLFYANMKTGCSILGLPETGIASAVGAQMASYYGFISDLYGMCCTSCAFDAQSGYEKAINCLLPFLSGANYVSGFGGLASLMVASYEQLVIDNEIYANVRKAAKGFAVDEDAFGFDVLAGAIKGGMILAHPHTIKYLKKGEVFIPKLGFDSVWSDWVKKGKKDIQAVARERAIELLKKDEQELEPLPADLDKEITKIIDQATAELVK
ncbi:MAG: trimethylamine methyltransferase family protein [Syntrophaceticus schinkii]|jgi:trimethylamine--corrinoid protein Co-methyltransferase|nr:trimethylamine methyltransferase family protein [Syntrophaceticus schinkii]MDD4261146.1 trimethylamine methyltransferase family protein [Syntrophaceticus schinkii]MDD4674917.1 trimethylamine methyltransferase family protein [Syntrophaceticus schinkii]